MGRNDYFVGFLEMLHCGDTIHYVETNYLNLNIGGRV